MAAKPYASVSRSTNRFLCSSFSSVVLFMRPMNFSMAAEGAGSGREVELVPGGATQPVTVGNAATYMRLVAAYEFGTRVLKITPDGDGWEVLTERNGEQQTRRFDGVLIANGTLHKPNMPTLPGEFSGEPHLRGGNGGH